MVVVYFDLYGLGLLEWPFLLGRLPTFIRLAWDKHSSLFCLAVSNEEKKFSNMATLWKNDKMVNGRWYEAKAKIDRYKRTFRPNFIHNFFNKLSPLLTINYFFVALK
jgi:hypothetical protein